MNMAKFFEVTAKGFDAASDETDGLVYWVVARDRAHVDAVIAGIEVHSVVALPDEWPDTDDIDFNASNCTDVKSLQTQLREHAAKVQAC
jgi:hypothetical protein